MATDIKLIARLMGFPLYVKRQRGDSNPCGQSPMDFESISLTARTHCHMFTENVGLCWSRWLPHRRGRLGIQGFRVKFPGWSRTPVLNKASAGKMTPVGFEPTQLALVELESTPLDHSGKVSLLISALRFISLRSTKEKEEGRQAGRQAGKHWNASLLSMLGLIMA